MGRRQRNRTAAGSRRRLRWERLEDRRLLAVATVTTLADTVDFNDGVTSLREAIFATNTVAGADTIEFDSALFAEGLQTILLTQGELKIIDSLTITGPGAHLLTIDASGNDPTPDSTLDDGDTTNDGDGTRVFLIDDGVRENRFTAEIRGVTLTGGDTDELRGGAIHSREHLTVAECIVTGNMVKASSGQGGWGGGIQTLYANLTVIDTTVTGNMASLNGGGIDFNRAGFDVALSIDGSTIMHNSAFRDGGGILIAGDATISNTTIADNFASQSGGGIAVWSQSSRARIKIENSHVTGNQAAIGGGFASYSSGAIVEIVDSNVANNTATLRGGGIAMGRSGYVPTGMRVLDIRGTTISGNSSREFAGIYLDISANPNGVIAASIDNSTISGNTAIQSFDGAPGGGIRARVRSLSITNSLIEENDGTGLEVNGVTTMGSEFFMADSVIRQNGSGTHLRNLSSSLTGVTIAANDSYGIRKIGGALAITGGSINDNLSNGVRNESGSLHVMGATISNNSSGENAGAGIYSQGALVVESSTIEGNSTRNVGGGIAHFVSNPLQITLSTIADNVSTESGGGGIYSLAPVTIVDSAIERNTARGHGGGVSSEGSVSMTRSVVAQNATTGPFSSGGGIHAIAQTNTVTVIESSVSNNSATGSGGGIYTTGVVDVRQSNVAHNEASGPGGGLFTTNSATITDSTVSHNLTTNDLGRGGGVAGRRVTVTQSTISNNRTLGDQAHGGGISAIIFASLQRATVADNEVAAGTSFGGGVHVVDGTMNFAGSIVANNTAGGGNPDLRPGGLISASYTLVGDTSGLLAQQVNALAAGTGNILNDDPHLGPLADNGGPVLPDGSQMLTHALLPGSPAIDAGNPAAVIGANGVTEFDQRGKPFHRIIDGDGVDGARIDIGAYERQPGEVFQLVVDTLEDELDGDYSTGDFSLREAIAIANLNPGNDTISFAEELWASGPATIYLEQGELAITEAVTIDGPGAELLTIDAQQQSRIFNIISTAGNFEIAGMTLTGGRTTGDNLDVPPATYSGGAIRSMSLDTLAIVDSVIANNSVIGALAEGGGIYARGALVVNRSVVSGNSTAGNRGYGGGISLVGPTTITGSVIKDNSTSGLLGRGGGVYSRGNVTINASAVHNNSTFDDFATGGGVRGSLVTIIGSTIASNSTSGTAASGGGIYGHAVVVSQSTISNNSTHGLNSDGAGILIIAGAGSEILHSTVAGNRAEHDSATGGGMAAIEGHLLLVHSIVAGNEAKMGNPDLFANSVITGHYSLVGDTSGLQPSQLDMLSAGEGNLLNQDPLLRPLADYGGPTLPDGSRMLTHMLAYQSPAQNAGDPSAMTDVEDVPEFDQRGIPWQRIAGGRIDMGAIEAQANPLAGDCNFDGLVDAIDYTVWRNTVGSADDLRADGSGEVEGVPDGVVDAFDYAWWKANYGNVLVVETASGSGGIAAVPTTESEIAAELRSADGGERSSPAIAPRAMLRFDLSATVAPRSRSADVALRPTPVATTLHDDALLAWLTSRHDERRVDVDGEDDAFDRQVGGDDATSDDAFAALACKI